MSATEGPLLLDASTWLAAVDELDQHHEPARELVRRRAVLALDLTPYEAANVAVVSWRSAERAEAIRDLILHRVARPLIAVTRARIGLAITLAQRHDITVYDAAYAAVADELRIQLVSCDVRDLVSNGLAVLPEDVVPDAS